LQQDIVSHDYPDAEAKRDKDAVADLAAKADASIRLRTYFGHLDAVSILTSAKEKFPSPRLHAEQVAEFEHPDGVASVALSPDGQTLATACSDGGIRLWDTLERRPPSSVDTAGHPGTVNAVTFSPDGSLLAWTRADFTVCIKRLQSKPEATVLKDSVGLTFPLVFDPTGRLLVTGRHDPTSAVVWDVQELREVATLSGHGGPSGDSGVRSLAFGPDGQFIASGDMAGVVRLWHSKDGLMVKSVSEQNDYAISGVAFSSDGSLLVGVGGACVAVWHVPDLMLVTRDELSIPSPLSCVSFAARDAILLFGNVEGGVGLTSWERGFSVESFEREDQRPAHDDLVWSIALSRGESMVATGSQDRWARLWKLHARGAFPRELLRRMDEEQSGLSANLRLRREKERRCVLCGQELGFWEKRRKQTTCGVCPVPGAPRSR
jgi:WD40 repeat protein